ncbi:MAG: hypothetical protein EA367_02890 [Leptolyngbya sp. DLM2.Bin15]|nr:MAG: hypothetical protein EA367_02890 [Leptolyngbya sp. DLM2.Bin15]
MIFRTRKKKETNRINDMLDDILADCQGTEDILGEVWQAQATQPAPGRVRLAREQPDLEPSPKFKQYHKH